jgi:CPA1 family monovalent cation:H+ antiporter
MDHSVWITVLGISGLLTLAVIVLPIANRLNFPFTVMLAAVGILIGLGAQLIPEGAHLGVISDLVQALQRMEITSEAVFFVFLPALVFESALSLDVRRLLDDIAPILLLAVVGLLISTVIVGLSLQWVSGYALLVCLLLGAIVSATDPVAVVAIFKGLGAPKRLAILVEGESLFNDATAIVVFTILSTMVLGTAETSLMGGVLAFLKVFLGGVAVGYVMARIACFMMGFLGDSALPKISLSIALAYLSFITAEHYLHMSGVMAVVTASLVLGSRGRSVISISAWHGLEEVWETIGFLANSVIFVLVGVAVPSIMAGFGSEQLTWLTVLIVTAFVARFAIIFWLAPVLSRFGWAAHVETGYKAVMFWGGLRGAVSLALALAVMENSAYDQSIRDFVGVLVTGFVLFTLAINATTVHLVMRMFGLDKLSPVDMAIRNRALSTGLSGIGESVRQAADIAQLEPQLANEVAQPVEQRAAAEQAPETDISREDWLRIGLRILAQNENQVYHRYFDQGLISPDTARALFSQAADIRDGVKTDGVHGFRKAYEMQLGFRWQTRIAGEIQRRLGISGPLAKRLASRFAILEANSMALRELMDTGIAKGREMVGEEMAQELRQLAQERLDATEHTLDGLRAAYPEYANQLEKQMLQQIAARLEHNEYKSMLGSSIIGKEVYTDLVRELDHRSVGLRTQPKLDLGLDAEKLVGKVPFFAELAYERKQEIARMLKPKLVLPGEELVHKGDKGDVMYFISSGAVRVEVEPKPVILGSGDFFGEMALLSDKPRKVSVFAEGFCDLLALYTKDFRALLDSQPDLKATIEKVAAERA